MEDCLATSESFDLSSNNLVYGGLLLFSHSEYIGESSTDSRTRLATHARESRTMRPRQYVHREIGRLGASLMVWYPLHIWNAQPTKIERLKREGRLMWSRNSRTRMNRAGNRGWAPHVSHDDTYLTAVRRHFRQFKRHVERARRMEGLNLIVNEDEGVRSDWANRRVDKEQLDLVYRLARRPMKKDMAILTGTFAQNLKCVKSKNISEFIRIALEVLDAPGRPIFMDNMTALHRGTGKVIRTSIVVKSPVLWMGKSKAVLLRQVRLWLKNREMAGQSVVLKVSVRDTTTKSVMDFISNAIKVASTSEAREQTCMFHSRDWEELDKLEGHIF